MWKFLSMPKAGSRAAAEAETCERSCAICEEVMGEVRVDGSTEIAFKLPCSHVFGSLCILRWLQESPQHDCPNCRRRMVHPGCGHLIMPHKLSTAPPSIPASETPAQCVQCRGQGMVAMALLAEQEKLLLREGALEGMRTHLPRYFGSQALGTVNTVDQRIADLRKGFSIFQERTWRKFDDRERREIW